MDVFLVPMGDGRYELYCEPAHAVAPEHQRAGQRWWHTPQRIWYWAVGVYGRAVEEGEAERDGAHDAAQSRGRIRRAISRRLAAAVAEQRLLWRLRHEASASLVHPDLIDGQTALTTARALLKADHDKHRLWCVIDALITVGTAPFALLPGPNFLAYYFIFRTVGHYLSMLGASRGLNRVSWSMRGSSDLTAIGQALPLDAAARDARLDAIAAALGLDRLSAFVQRAAGRS